MATPTTRRRRRDRTNRISTALAYIDRHIADPITITDLANAAGVPYRTFTAWFRAELGVPVRIYLRQKRMNGARADLTAATLGQTTVTEIALAWGWPHLTRFARVYRATYGERPSETLRRPPPPAEHTDDVVRHIPTRVGIRVTRCRPQPIRISPPAELPPARRAG